MKYDIIRLLGKCGVSETGNYNKLIFVFSNWMGSLSHGNWHTIVSFDQQIYKSPLIYVKTEN